MSEPILINGNIDSVTPKGMGRIAGKIPCYVPYTATGDEVVVRIVKQSNTYQIGHVTQLLTPSPDRVQPPCSHFGSCGGCQFMHLSLHQQRQIKQYWLESGLQNAGIQATILPWIVSDEIVSRRRIRLQATRNGDWGMNRWHSAMIEPIQRCSVISTHLQQIMNRLPLLPPAPPDAQLDLIQIGELVWIMIWGIQGTQGEYKKWHHQLGVDGSRWHHQNGGHYEFGVTSGTERVGPLEMPIRMGAFTQHHPELLESLVDAVMQSYHGQRMVWDLYGGGGLFGYQARHRGALGVVIVETNPMAILDAQSHVLYGPSCEVIESSVLDFLDTKKSDGGADWVIADPPRCGLGGEVIKRLLNRLIPEITLIHCQWESMIRDVGALVKGGYEIKRVQPIDLFPHTIHFELVTHLIKKKGGLRA